MSMCESLTAKNDTAHQQAAHLIIFQDDLPPAHLADELQELAVLHLRVRITAQQIRQGFGIPSSSCSCLRVRAAD